MPSQLGNGDPPSQRLDKWLWVSRFFKTRSLATAAVSGGKVQLDGQRVKPARRVGPGNLIRIVKEPHTWEVVIKDVSKIRLPAAKAVLLYRQTEQSIVAGERMAALRKAEIAERDMDRGRPGKHDRREARRLKRS